MGQKVVNADVAKNSNPTKKGLESQWTQALSWLKLMR